MQSQAVFRVLCTAKYCGYCQYWQYFELLYCGCFRTRSISAFVTVCGYSPCFQILRASVLRVLQVRAVFHPLVLLVLRVLAVPKYFQYAQYTRNRKCTYTICAPCAVDNYVPIVFQKTFADGWSHEWELEHTALGGGTSSGSISGTCTAGTRSTSRFCTVLRILPELPSISGFDTAGTACTRGSVMLILPALAVFGPLLLLIPPVLVVFRSILQYSQYSEYEVYSILREYS